MSKIDFSGIVLNEDEILVKVLEDYFSKVKEGDLNTNIESLNTTDVGIIEHVGTEIPKEWIGKVVYFHKQVSTAILLKNIGSYHLVKKHSKLIVRLDQNINNY